MRRTADASGRPSEGRVAGPRDPLNQPLIGYAMKDWFLKNLGDATLAFEPLERIEKMLLSAYASAGSPYDMAAFMRHESEGCLHCQLKVYLSPNLVDVAVEIDAEPCGKPSPVGLSLLHGSQDAIKSLFPDGVV